MVAQTLQFHVEAEDQNVCWICLEGSGAGELLSPCKCPSRFVHRPCLARWQLHSAGREWVAECLLCIDGVFDCTTIYRRARLFMRHGHTHLLLNGYQGAPLCVHRKLYSRSILLYALL
jgi:hypothetical protein